ncbi:hypothetical protein GGH12_002527 [Coemansia sp. RSA 1822]|nr:hypothetical protein LPJ76_005802 [Coemansia sp. RSA 638]KAJ2541839.1 hypothetical protein GGF49_003365 [Coemansia sp. RSA 1853]KAJ2563553.1 hypothetical protein GGH12_002527 [Coemansia sp. RSA 1822]
MEKFNSFFKEVNGLRMAEQKPIHYFVCSVGSNSLHLDNRTEENTIVEYFDSEDVVDLAKFAEIVKSKPNCVQKHFIVNKGTEYCAVETDNVKNTYIISSIRRYQFVPKLAAGTATIDTFIDYDKHLEDMATKLESQPGFKLRDSNGKVIPDGKEFAIQILNDPEEYLNEEDMEDIYGHTSIDPLFRGKEWIGIYDGYGNSGDDFLYGQTDGGDSFECETIDDIVYLKYDGEYLFFDDDKSDKIFIGKAVPAKEQRIQIHCDDNGDIWLTKWDSSAFFTCEWIKCAYGAIYLCEYDIPQKFRLVSL